MIFFEKYGQTGGINHANATRIREKIEGISERETPEPRNIGRNHEHDTRNDQPMGTRQNDAERVGYSHNLPTFQRDDGRNAQFKKKERLIEKCVISIEGVELERVLNALLSSADATATIAVKLEIARPTGEADS